MTRVTEIGDMYHVASALSAKRRSHVAESFEAAGVPDDKIPPVPAFDRTHLLKAPERARHRLARRADSARDLLLCHSKGDAQRPMYFI